MANALLMEGDRRGGAEGVRESVARDVLLQANRSARSTSILRGRWISRSCSSPRSPSITSSCNAPFTNSS
jgi:hypothetical protein